MLYFAYGSNMSTARLIRRVPSAILLGSAVLARHRLCFHKIGRDNSAKCDALFTGQEANLVLGALYRIDPVEKQYLDQAEGLGNGYETKQVTVLTTAAKKFEAYTYYATRTDPRLKPFHWYKNHVLRGAVQLDLPQEYRRQIEAVVSIDDPDPARSTAETAIHATGCRAFIPDTNETIP